MAVIGLGVWWSSDYYPGTKTPLPGKGTLVIWAWDGYFPEELRKKFRQETGFILEVRPEALPADEDVVDVLAVADPVCDLIMPSANVGKELSERDLIARFDRALFSTPHVLPIATATVYNPEFDPDNEVVIPYAWGATGIGYDVDRVDGLPSSWAAIFEARPHRDQRNTLISRPLKSVVMLDDARFTLGSMLLYQGESPNTKDPAAVHRAADRLVALQRLAQADEDGEKYYAIEFEEEAIPDLLRSGRQGLSMTWSADVTAAMHDLTETNKAGKEVVIQPGNPRVRLALPEEGSIVFRDSFMVPLRAHHRRKGAETAGAAANEPVGDPGWEIDPAKKRQWHAVHQLIEFMLRPENAARVTESSKFATTVKAADSYIDPFLTNGPSFFRHSAGKNQFLEVQDDAMRKVYQAAWANVKGNRLYAETQAIAHPVEVQTSLPDPKN